MSGSGDGTPPPYFARPRVIAGLACIAIAIGLSLLDVASRDFSLDSIQLGLFLGTGLLFLGVESGRSLLK